MPRQSHQSGTVILVQRKHGSEWRFRWREGEVHRSEYIGSTRQYPTKAQAEKAADRFRRRILHQIEVVTLSDLIAKFWQEANPARKTTADSYRSIFRRIESDFGSLRIDRVAENPARIESWLKGLTVNDGADSASPLYRSQVRNLFHLLLEKAMLWGHLHADRNPVELVRLKDGSKRKSEPVILTLEQYDALLADDKLPELVKVMVQIAVCLGLRVSELLGLKWQDFDFENRTITIRRSVVAGKANATKTSGSAQTLPLHEELIGVLRMWKLRETFKSQWVFVSERTGLPYDRDYLREEYLKPAGGRIGVQCLGWHDLRHFYRALLRKSGTPLEAQKTLMRHARLATTVDVYGGQEQAEEVRQPNANVVEMVMRRTA